MLLWMTIQMKAVEHYVTVVLFIRMLYKVVLALESVDEFYSADHSVKATGQCFHVDF